MRTLAFLISLVAVNAVAVCYRHPFPNPTLSDGWGSTCCGRTNPHRGLDYPQASGTNIPSIADGVVRQRVYNSCLGNIVVVEHEGGIFSAYSHMLSQSPLTEGTTVTKGQTVGRVGNTGTCSYGAHLHLTIAPRVDGYWVGTT
ncbi:MAG TPA: M23 family metallopeptidase, partial [Archangium sp.]